MSQRITMTVKGLTVGDYVDAIDKMLKRHIDPDTISTVIHLLNQRYESDQED